MQGHAIPDHLSFCLISGEPVFLDVARDRYFRLGPALTEAFSQLRCPADGVRPDEAVALLREAGIIEPVKHPSTFDPAPGFIPDGSLIEEEDPRPAPGLLAPLEVAADLLRLRRSLARGRLDHMIGDLRRARAEHSGAKAGEERTGTLAATFLAARRWIPVAPACLADSLALSAFLARRGAFPSLVVGVKLDPFAAHCWVQTPARVLNDAAGHAADFTPILVA